MYLFSRRAHLTGTESLEWAIAITARAGEATSNVTQLWASAYSAGVGDVTWTSWWEDLGSMEAAFAKLQADAVYLGLVAEASERLDGSVDDQLYEVLSGAPDQEGDPQYVGSVSAVLASGSFVRGLTAGLEISAKVEAITGVPSLFLRGLSGPYGGIGWISGYESLAAFEEANGKMEANADWLPFLDSLDGCFVADASVTQATLFQKLA